MKSNSFWQRLRFKFRISVLNENTLNEVWHIRLSRFGMFTFFASLLLVSFAILAALVWFTPLRNYLPGYDANVREQMLSNMERVDSLNNQLALQTEYLAIIRNVVTGEVQTDSVAPLDSLTVRQKTELLDQRSKVTDEFIAQYEEKERENLAILDPHTTVPMLTLFRPAHGSIIEHFDDNDDNAILLQTPKNENVTAILKGTVVFCQRFEDKGWVMMLQHENDYVSIYRNLTTPLKAVGSELRQGETIAVMSGELPLSFQLWQNCNPINPEEVIVF